MPNVHLKVHFVLSKVIVRTSAHSRSTALHVKPTSTHHTRLWYSHICAEKGR